MSETMNTAFLFLISTVFNLYLFVLAIRLVLAWVHFDYYSPVTQFVAKVTDFIVKPLRRLIPNFKKLETATVVVMLFIECIKFFLIIFISYTMPNLIALPVMAIADFFYLLIQTFTYAIILQAILSFVQPHSPLLALLYRFTSPIMRPIQRYMPLVGGIDLSPIPALIILQLLNILVVMPIMAIGQSMA